MAVRTTIHLQADLAAKLHELVPGRGLNRFINEAVAEKVAAIERQRIEELMKEGYLATCERDLEIAADWEAVDLEGWPEWQK